MSKFHRPQLYNLEICLSQVNNPGKSSVDLVWMEPNRISCQSTWALAKLIEAVHRISDMDIDVVDGPTPEMNLTQNLKQETETSSEVDVKPSKDHASRKCARKERNSNSTAAMTPGVDPPPTVNYFLNLKKQLTCRPKVHPDEEDGGTITQG